ncbi:MAG: phosphatidate cytidylyltransferase [Erysipelotrichaceae bacterium]|nr:phosphatidate cytidylyltransferase [Erysipelotrichaceae bacterium]
MRTRIITGLLIGAVALPALFVGGTFFNLLILAIVIFSGYEMVHIATRPRFKFYLYPLVMVFLGLGFYFYANRLVISTSFFLILLIELLVAAMFDDTLDLGRISYLFFAGVLIFSGLHYFYHIRMDLGLEYVMLLVLATFGCDTGAYFAGIKFGKNKLIPRISPKKTIEGSIGGILLGSLLSISYGLYTGILSSNLSLVLACVLLTITSQIGDLTFSVIKRTFNAKDFSNLLPGHGGVLDRIDSMLLNSIVLGLIMWGIK